MSTYVALMNFTEKGISKYSDTLKRAEAFRESASRAGVTIKQIYWTLGRYDGVIILEGDDAAITSTLLKLGALGNVRTETLHAFDDKAMQKVLQA